MEIGKLPIPGMMELTVAEALAEIARLGPETRESAALCSHLPERLRFLREELANNTASQLHAEALSGVSTQFTATIGLIVRFLKKHAEKKPLSRLAASRVIRDQVRVLHGKIDAVFTVAGLSKAPEMVEWKQHEAADITTQHSLLEELVGNPTNLVDDLAESSLVEALTELKFEINSRQNPGIFTELMTKVLGVVVELTGTTIPDIPSWFIRRDEVEVGEIFEYGSFGVVNKGIWRDKEVCVKVLYMDGADTETDFLKEATVWHGLAHPNIVKFYGGCHVGKSLFFVSELASEGNFVEYFDHSENKNKMWRFFYQVAKGLAYLHSRRVVHGALKCNDLLVGDDETAKICDFGFSFISNDSIEKSIKEQSTIPRWKAPECIFEQGTAANPTFKSDVYSLGMSIIEAKTGSVPWGMVDDDEIIDQLASGEGYLRPEGVFTDRKWRLVQAMTKFDPRERMTTEEALETLAEFAQEEAGAKNELEAKRQADIEKEFQSIVVDERVMKDLERVVDFIHNLRDEDQESRDELVRRARQMQTWLKKEAVDRKNWEANVPTSSRCDACGSLNALDSPFCCDCGSLIDGYRSREETVFRFFVSDQSDLHGAIHALETLTGTAESYRSQTVMCPGCEKPNPIGKRFCIDCVSRLDTAKPLHAADDPVRIMMLHQITRLNVIRQHSRDEEARSQLLTKEEPQVLVCSNCGDLNPKDELFCRECGNDIEIICGVKL